MTNEKQPAGVCVIAVDGKIDLIELFKAFWANKLIVVVITAIFTTGAVFHGKSLPNIYTSEVIMMPVNSDGNAISGGLGSLGGLVSFAGISVSGKGNTAANLAIIKSRQFVMGFIKENNILPMIFHEEWDSINRSWILKDKNKIPTLQKGYAKFMKDILSIKEDKKTGLIILKISWLDPSISAKWANLIVEKANYYLKQKAIDEANESIVFLKEHIKNTNEVGIQELLYKLIEKELQTTKLASIRKDYAFKVLDPALESESYDRPNRMMIKVIGILLGFIAALIIVAIKVMFNCQKQKV